MKNYFFLLILISSISFSQSLVRIQPENFSTVYGFGGSGSFNNTEIVISGQDAMPPTGIPKLYLFNQGESGIIPNGTLNPPEINQIFSGGVEMTDDFLYVGSMSNNTNVTNGGAVYVFNKVNGNWVFLSKIQPSNQNVNDYFGSNIKFHDGQLFITASGFDINGEPTAYEGAIYVYNQNGDDFILQQIITGVAQNYGLGSLLDVESEMLMTTSTTTTNDFIHVFKKVNSTWQNLGITQMPVISFSFNPNLTVPHHIRVSFSNGKLYLYHLMDFENDIFGQKMIKIYNWNQDTEQFDFEQNFIFQEGDYYKYKVKVHDNSMFIIPTGEYILLAERKNPVYHFVNLNGTWTYNSTYTGMSSYTNDSFGAFTLTKENKVLFGNANEYWINPIMAPNGGAYLLEVTLGVNQFSKNDFVIYPNPANEKVFIYAQNSEITSVELFDSLGKKVLKSVTFVSELDISNLKSGIYFCKIKTKENSIMYQKIIKR